MAIEFKPLKKTSVDGTATYEAVRALAERLRAYLDAAPTQELLRARHVFGASSAEIQKVVLEGATPLGFESEKGGLFSEYPVPGLRPDFFCRVNETGILLEVERGKTTTNNMDLLDLWKCHICDHARYLFLVVPQERPSANGRKMRHFSHVVKRLGPFFEPRNHVNVDAVFLYGY